MPIALNPNITDEPDRLRRALVAATATLGGVALLAAAYPLVATLEPSARALAEGGPVDYDFSALRPGQLDIVAWRGQPVWIMRRSAEMVAVLQRPNDDLADPLSRRSEQPTVCVNATRSLQPDLFVAVGICTHLGCSPALRLDDAALNAEFKAPGAFFCPCHGSRFDLADRVARNVPAPTNLSIPDHSIVGAGALRIG